MIATKPSIDGNRRDLIVVLARDAHGLLSDKSEIDTAVRTRNGLLHALFPSTEKPPVNEHAARLLREMQTYFWVEAPDNYLDEIAAALQRFDGVEAAYVQPESEMMRYEISPSIVAPPSRTPDYTGRQVHLGPAPGGINVLAAWNVAGGDGNGVAVIDIEWNWEVQHEDHARRLKGVLFGTPSRHTNHGTAVIGVIGADMNDFGVVGISPGSWIGLGAVSSELKSATALRLAADLLKPGDILLVEIHRPGPRYNFQKRSDELGYIAIEWWPADFLAIQYAVSRGVIVVEPAGNGAENLDDPLYDIRHPQFPPTWKNPFGRVVDSGAVVVGAGAPPRGTHGRDWGEDRSRLDESNYGRVLDVQGWGREVTTTGGGDLQDGTDRRRWYTDAFRSTSAAAAMVVGVLACVQGARKAVGKTLFNSFAARSALRATGSPQQPDTGKPLLQRIGNRPNLAELVNLP
jgi:hypothetical protein